MKDKIKFTDVTPLSLGIEVNEYEDEEGPGDFDIIVERNSQLPITKSCEYGTAEDD